MEYKIKTNITAEDYINFNSDYYKKNTAFQIFLAIILIFIAVNCGMNKFARGNLIRIIVSYFPLIFLLLVYFLYFKCFWPIILRQTYKSDRILQEETILTLSENNINESMDRGYFNYTTKDFNKVIFGKKMISIYISKKRAILIPRHCFTSKDDEREIEEFIKTNYAKKR